MYDFFGRSSLTSLARNRCSSRCWRATWGRFRRWLTRARCRRRQRRIRNRWETGSRRRSPLLGVRFRSYWRGLRCLTFNEGTIVCGLSISPSDVVEIADCSGEGGGLLPFFRPVRSCTPMTKILDSSSRTAGVCYEAYDSGLDLRKGCWPKNLTG